VTLTLGVSACLAGQKVRYDGTDARCDKLTSIFSTAKLEAVCPESEIGLGVPRPTMHLERKGGGLHLIVTEDGRNLSLAMDKFSKRRVEDLPELDGFVLKSKSPSCAVRSAAVAGDGRGRGLFATMLTKLRRHLPVCEERDLDVPDRARDFVRQVYSAARQREFFAGGWRHGELMAHHSRYSLLLISRDPAAAAALDARVSAARTEPAEEIERHYRAEVASILAKPSAPDTMQRAFESCIDWLRNAQASKLRAVDTAVAEYGDDATDAMTVLKCIREAAYDANLHYLVQQHFLGADSQEWFALAECVP